MKPRKTQGFIFTEKRLREILPVSECARQQYFDEECKGLILRVSRSTKSFIFRHRGAYVTLGTWPIMSVENARKAVRERVAPDPEAAQKAKRTKREAETLGESWADLLDNPMRRDGRGLLRKKTLQGYKTLMRASQALVQ